MYFVGARISAGRWAISRAPPRQKSLTICCSRSHIIVVVKVVVVTVVVIVRVVVVEKRRRRSLVAFTSFFILSSYPPYSLFLFRADSTDSWPLPCLLFSLRSRWGSGAEYCDEHVCLSVFRRAYLWNYTPFYQHILCMLPVAMAPRRHDVLPYVFPVFCMTSYFPIVKAMEACRCRCSDAVNDGEH